MMALNIAVPMSGVGDLLEGFGLLSPISPVNIDFRSSIKNPLSPVGSESSGVSSLDLEDVKKQMPSSPTLLDENDEEGPSSSGPEKSSSNSSSLSAGSTISTTSSRTCSTSSSSSSSSSSASDDETNQLDEKLSANPSENDDDVGGAATVVLSATSTAASSGKETDVPACTMDEIDALIAKSNELLKLAKKELVLELPFLSTEPPTKEPIFSLPRQSISYNKRDILDLGSNLRAQPGSASVADEFTIRYAELPVTNNIQFFLQNRSQYHRLGPNGHVPEYRNELCACCDFQYPVNTVGANSTAAPGSNVCGTLNFSNLNANQIYGNLQQQQQQQQQQQLQLQLQQRQRLMQYQQQQQQQQQYAAYRNGSGNAGSSMGRDYNMYQAGGGGASAGGAIPSSSRFNNGVYGSVSGASSPNAQAGGGMAASGGNGGFFNNNNALGGLNSVMGRDQYNPMGGSMTMQYNHNNNTGANIKGISQMNGAPSQSSAALRQQQQQLYSNNYSMGAGANAMNNPSSGASARLQQQQQQQQQSSHFYKKNQSMRYGGPSGVNGSMMSSGPTASNWRNSLNNNAVQDTATKLWLELNKQQQQQQQSPYYVPFL